MNGMPVTYMKADRILLSTAMLLAAVLHAGTDSNVRYFSNAGDDAADGLTPQTAWCSLEKLAKDLPAGGEARLRRGDTFYGRVRLKPGRDAAHRTTLTAYGDGPAPEISAFKIAKPTLGTWTFSGTNNLWRLDLSDFSKIDGNHMTSDGNVGFLKVDGTIFARKLFDLERLQKQWDFIDDGRTVTVWSQKNPSELSKDIRIAPNMGTIPFVNHMELRGVVVRGTGAHGSNGVGADIRIVDCGFHEIGGSKLPGYGDGRTRYGNCIECWAGSTDVQVTRCSFSGVYDVAFTMQGPNPCRSWENVHVTDSVFSNCTQCIEIWTTKCKPGIGMKSCSFQRNVCVNSGFGWGYDTRPNKDCSTPLLVYGMQTDVCDLLVKDNTFINNRLALVYKADGLGELPEGYLIEGNTIIGNPTIRQHGGKRPDATAAREALIRSRNTFRSLGASGGK